MYVDWLSMNVSVKDDTDTLALTVSENMDVSGVLVMEGEPAEYKVEGDKLSITSEGQTLVMTKVK